MMLSYSGHLLEGKQKDVDVCQFHWDKHCKDGDKFDLRTHFKRKKK